MLQFLKFPFTTSATAVAHNIASYGPINQFLRYQTTRLYDVGNNGIPVYRILFCVPVHTTVVPYVHSVPVCPVFFSSRIKFGASNNNRLCKNENSFRFRIALLCTMMALLYV